MGKAAGDDCALLRLTLLDHLQRREVAACCLADPAAAGSGQPDAPAQVPAPDVTLRAAILGSEGHWTEACDAVQPPAVCDAAVLQRIAAQLPADHREQAVALWLRVFAAVMPHASSPFSAVLSLVRQICDRMDASQRAAWLAHLRLEYKVKRNFVRGLPVR